MLGETSLVKKKKNLHLEEFIQFLFLSSFKWAMKHFLLCQACNDLYFYPPWCLVKEAFCCFMYLIRLIYCLKFYNNSSPIIPLPFFQTVKNGQNVKDVTTALLENVKVHLTPTFGGLMRTIQW